MNRAIRNKGAPRALAALLSSLLIAGAAQAAPKQPESNVESNPTQTAAEQYREMSRAERLDVLNEAMGNADMKSRPVTASEKAMISMKPADARRLAKPEATAKRAGGSGVGREFRNGSAVGVVVGTAFMMERKVALTADGKHLETCGHAAHSHDTKTAALIQAAREATKGVKHD